MATVPSVTGTPAASLSSSSFELVECQGREQLEYPPSQWLWQFPSRQVASGRSRFVPGAFSGASISAEDSAHMSRRRSFSRRRRSGSARIPGSGRGRLADEWRRVSGSVSFLKCARLLLTVEGREVARGGSNRLLGARSLTHFPAGGDLLHGHCLVTPGLPGPFVPLNRGSPRAISSGYGSGTRASTPLRPSLSLGAGTAVTPVPA